MKAASKMPLVKATLKEKHMTGIMIENCGMPEEHIYHKIDEIPRTGKLLFDYCREGRKP